MERWYYLVFLLVSISGLAICDWRYRLAFWYDKRRSLLVMLCALFFFVCWDIAGIRAGVFFHGGSAYTLPVRLYHEFPIEEIGFLILLAYTTLLVYRAGDRR